MREALAGQIVRGEPYPGDRLLSERLLQIQFDCARSVARPALQSPARDGWVSSIYSKGYLILGPISQGSAGCSRSSMDTAALRPTTAGDSPR